MDKKKKTRLTDTGDEPELPPVGDVEEPGKLNEEPLKVRVELLRPGLGTQETGDPDRVPVHDDLVVVRG